MRALVVEGPDRVSYSQLEAPRVDGYDVLVRSHEAGLCRTDIEMMTGVFTDPRWVRFPVVPGHEWSGTVIEVGEHVSSVGPGDRVVCEGFITCGRCAPCRRGQTQWCEHVQALGFTRPGGYAELVSVPEQVVHKLPGHVSFDAGVLVEPASVVLHALEKAAPQPGERAGVIGVGTLGALSLALLALHSPSELLAFGVRDEELELALALGATDVVQVSQSTAPARELDLVLETAGAVAAAQLATALCRPGGRAVLLGIAGEGRMLSLPSDLLVSKDMTLIGSIAYPRSVWARVVGLLADRVLDVERIVTHRYPIAEFSEAIRFMDARQGIVGKIVLEHE